MADILRAEAIESMKKFGKTLGSGTRPGPKLFKKAARLVISKGFTPTAAMKAVGYSKTTAEHQQKILTENPVFKAEGDSIRAALLRREPKVYDRLADTMLAGLKAKETKHFAYLGLVHESRKSIDWSERRQSAELIAAVFGELRPKDDARGGAAINVNVLVQLVNGARAERGLPV